MNGGPGVRNASRFWDVLLALLLLLGIFRLWVMPLWSSFWVDETVTAFVVRQGPDHPSLRVAPQVPQSIYYQFPRATTALFGTSEAAYRVPSLLAMMAALLVIARLAARLIHPQAGWVAVFACMTLRGFDYQAADARPYGLGMLVACASLWFLIRWLDSARWRDALLFVISAALLWRVHLIFWPFYLVFGIYVLLRLVRRETPIDYLRAAAVFAVLGLALAPCARDALALNRQAGAHVIVDLPFLRDVIFQLKLGLILTCGLTAWLLARILRSSPDAKAPPRSSIDLVMAWWLCPPVCLFGYSWLTGNSVFLARYLWLALPGGALLAVMVAARFLSSAHWKLLAAVLGAAALAMNGQWDRVWPYHHDSDWRAAARQIRELDLEPDAPVICPSPYVEAKPPDWYPDYPLPGFLYAPLAVYPISAKTYLFPYERSPEGEAFARRLTAQTLPTFKRFVLWGGQGQVDFWTKWFNAQPELAGWGSRHLRMFGEVEVVVFDRPR